MYCLPRQLTNFIYQACAKPTKRVDFNTRKIHTLNPTHFSLTCVDGGSDEHELGKILAAEEKKLIPAKGFGADGTNPRQFRI